MPHNRGRGPSGRRGPPAEILKALENVPGNNQKLRRQDFTLTNGTANQRSKVAEYQAELPLAFREAPMRLVFVVVEEFTTDGSASNQETFSLANNLIDTENTSDLILYEGGSRVQEDSIDYTNNSFDYTDDGTNNTLDVFYVARNPVQVEIEKVAPKSQGQVSEVVYDDVSSILHERNQNKEPPVMEFDDEERPLARVVPKDWTIEVYADGPIAFAWDDSGTGTDNSATATNAMLSIPVRRATENINGLGQAVRDSAAQA